jgi:hypothetical protein
MITKGYILQVRYKNQVIERDFNLACSEDDKELEIKARELTQKNYERQTRFFEKEVVINEYLGKLKNYLSNCTKEIREIYDYDVERFYQSNPIPSEISEFVKFHKDRDICEIYATDPRDFEIEYFVTNLLGFKNENQ